MTASPNLDVPSVSAGQPDVLPDISPPIPAAEGYERWAPLYDQIPNPLLAREERYLLPLLPDLRGRPVLDLACGTCRWLEKLVVRGCGPGIGIDSSMAMLRVAATKNAARGRILRASCENVPISSAAFDLAICSFALGHISDLDPVVRELARVMKPTADVFVSDLHPEAYARGWRVGFRDCGTAVQIEMRSRSTEEIKATFCANGFRCEREAPLWLGDPEAPLFERAGKRDSFLAACQLPAVLIFHFRRPGSVAERQTLP